MTETDLGTELRRTAEQTVESILDAARAEAKLIALEADRWIEDRRTEVIKGEEDRFRSDARVAIAAERHGAMRAVLLARTRVVDRVLKGARALLPRAAQTEAYRSTLEGEVVEALKFVDEAHAVVRCSPELAESIRNVLRERPTVTVEPDADVGTGFIVAELESVSVDGRLETRIERLESVLAIEILARLRGTE